MPTRCVPGAGSSGTLRVTILAFLLALSTVAIGPARAQEAVTLSYSEPAEAGMSAEVLDGALGLYREAVERGDLVGAVILVARNGKVVLHEALGWSDRDAGAPMAPNTLFHMASNTKPVVATGIATLVEAGELDWDDLVRIYLPEWDNYRSGFITVAHLLSHSSGLRIPTLFLQPMADDTDLVREAARFGSVGAEVLPGTSYSYSNPGFNTLGALIELRSGEDLESYLDKVVYTPLGMEDSYNYRADHPLDGKRNRLGPVYYRRDGSGAWVPGTAVSIPFARGSGGMVSTAWDYAVFLQAFLNGGAYGGERILEEETVAALTAPRIDRPGGSYGYGWFLEDGTFGHSGSDGTNAWVDPERGIIGLVFTQTPRGRPDIQRFRAMVNLAVQSR